MNKGIPHIDMFEAGAAHRSAHNLAMKTAAFTRNYDHPHYSGIRSECRKTHLRLEQGVVQMKTAAISPQYAAGMGW